jgi:small subunit ribosomal protein S2
MIKKKINKIQSKNNFLFNSLFALKSNYGHPLSEVHPKLFKYLYGIRQKQSVINLDLTIYHLKKALNVFKQIVNKEEGKILIVYDKLNLKGSSLYFKDNKRFIFFNSKWIVGSLTNKTLSNNLRLKNKFSAVVLFDLKDQEIVLNEVKSLNVPIIGIMDTDINPKGIDYPIVTNNSFKSIYLLIYFFNIILKKNIQSNRMKAQQNNKKKINKSKFNKKNLKQNNNEISSTKKKGKFIHKRKMSK